MELTESEIGSSTDNLSFRQLIMQKLSAARELKLKQSRSSSNTPDPKSHSSQITHSNNSWELEKQLLINMFEKSQQFASQTQQSFIEERKILETQIECLNMDLQKLALKNKEMERVIDKFKKVGGDRVEILKELQSLDQTKEICTKEEIEKLREELIETKNKLILSQNGLKLGDEKKKINEVEMLLNKVQNENAEKEFENQRLKDEIKSFKHASQKTNNFAFSAENNFGINENDSQIGILSKVLVDTQNLLVDQESQFLKERENWKNEKLMISEQIARINNDLNESKHLAEIEVLKQKIKEKDDQIAEFKNSPNKYSSDLSDLKRTLTTISEEILNIIKSDNSLELEIDDYKKTIADLEYNSLHTENSNLRTQLKIALDEKNYAKRLVISYIKSIQRLEKIISEKATILIDDQIATLQLEMSRLDEENQGLVSALYQKQTTYESEIKNLQKIIEIQVNEIKDLKNKLEIKINPKTAVKATDMKHKYLNDLQTQLKTYLYNLENKLDRDHKPKTLLSKIGKKSVSNKNSRESDNLKKEIKLLKQEKSEKILVKELDNYYTNAIRISQENIDVHKSAIDNLVKFTDNLSFLLSNLETKTQTGPANNDFTTEKKSSSIDTNDTTTKSYQKFKDSELTQLEAHINLMEEVHTLEIESLNKKLDRVNTHQKGIKEQLVIEIENLRKSFASHLMIQGFISKNDYLIKALERGKIDAKVMKSEIKSLQKFGFDVENSIILSEETLDRMLENLKNNVL